MQWSESTKWKFKINYRTPRCFTSFGQSSSTMQEISSGILTENKHTLNLRPCDLKRKGDEWCYAWLNDVLAIPGTLREIFSTVNHTPTFKYIHTIHDNGAWFKLTLHISVLPYDGTTSSHSNNACI